MVVDARTEPFPLTDALAQAIADRREGVGCDQLLILEPPSNGSADVFLRIRNHDGGEVDASRALGDDAGDLARVGDGLGPGLVETLVTESSLAAKATAFCAAERIVLDEIAAAHLAVEERRLTGRVVLILE